MQHKMKAHSKHAKLTKPNFGSFARNEWAFLGAPCDLIKNLVEAVSEVASEAILYIDESHNKDAEASKLSITTKKGGRQDFHKGLVWNKNNNFIQFNEHDFVFVNGNHFKASNQLLILDPRKEESLSRKLNRLTDVKAIITTDQQKEPYGFIADHLKDVEDIPRFDISETKAIWEFIKNDFIVPELKALVLAGGKSQRMGHDKGSINYHGKGQARHLVDMISLLGIDTHISCRADQADTYQGLNQVHDNFIGLGPFGAIASAFMQAPNAAWLIVPCDLPLLQGEHIKKLTEKRNPHRFATAFLNSETNFPEPLISIWEPKMYQQLLSFLAQGYSCPRKVLINSEVELIEVADQAFMMNVNTPEQKETAAKILEKK